MHFNEFQDKSRATVVYPNEGSNYVYPVLGLMSEAGEVADRVKRIDRDDAGVVTAEKRQEIASELGDVLWYVAQVATEFKLSLDDVAAGNMAKLSSRHERGTLNGFGAR
ncbi:MAG TPA: nucleoside triphosphate pyrophosphohydrolase family protein [Pseudonocardiaceae bacterium]|jgi:NTP pyrophosphatase (non-canonical NTP hydrolase)|nr:nucleoside triphosphate pyrophosphohydrolase family protein [Pseudonocardiaceae bacterium]